MVQSFAAEHLKTPLGEPVKGGKNKTVAGLWLDKFYKKVTTLPMPFPHQLVDTLEQYLDVLSPLSSPIVLIIIGVVVMIIGIMFSYSSSLSLFFIKFISSSSSFFMYSS